MTQSDMGSKSGGSDRTRGSIRLVPAVTPPANAPAVTHLAAHPLTTTALTLLPSRDAGHDADIWEEIDRAAAWVHDEVRAGRVAAHAGRRGGGSAMASDEQIRHALRVLCVATRGAWEAIGSGTAGPGAGIAVRRDDLPAAVPAAALTRLLRQRLTEQTVAARAAGVPAARADDVLRALVAMQSVEQVLQDDGVQHVVDQLTGASAMDLLVEIAHDMRSPLGSILFLVERLRSDGVRPQDDRALALVYGAAFGLSAMVSDVMELARGGDRLTAGEAGAFVVADVLSAVRDIAAPLAAEKGLVLDMEEPPREVRLGHGPALHRVLVNLVTNALKYTVDGQVVVSVERVTSTRLAFVIRDTGRGIPPRVLQQLFQTFRLRASGEDYAFSSAGLGLAICQRLLSAMGSELRVESAEGVGTTFRFELELPQAA